MSCRVKVGRATRDERTASRSIRPHRWSHGRLPATRADALEQTVTNADVRERPSALSLALWTIRPKHRLLPPASAAPQGSLTLCRTLGHRQRVQAKPPTEDLPQDPWSAESSLASAHARPSTELQPVDRACARRTMNGPHDISFSHCLTTTHDTTISGSSATVASAVLGEHSRNSGTRADRDERGIAGHVLIPRPSEARPALPQWQEPPSGPGDLMPAALKNPGAPSSTRKSSCPTMTARAPVNSATSCLVSRRGMLFRARVRTRASPSALVASLIFHLGVVRGRTSDDVAIRGPANNNSLSLRLPGPEHGAARLSQRGPPAMRYRPSRGRM